MADSDESLAGKLALIEKTEAELQVSDDELWESAIAALETRILDSRTKEYDDYTVREVAEKCKAFNICYCYCDPYSVGRCKLDPSLKAPGFKV